MTKICSKCGEEKPATTEYFRKAKANKDGLRGQCKVCQSEYDKQYRKKNKENIQQLKKQLYKENAEYYQEYNKQYYQENKEYFKQYRKQYRQENAEYHNEYMKQWRKENRKHINQYSRQYYQENKEHYREYFKQYRQENKERRRQHFQTYQARKRTLPHTLTLEQWEKIKNDFNNECAYCGQSEQEHKEEFNEQLHQEHFIPLSKGGEYTHNNIIPACRNCNSSKNNTDFFEWYPTYEYYNEEREQFILEYLGYIEDTQQQALL